LYKPDYKLFSPSCPKLVTAYSSPKQINRNLLKLAISWEAHIVQCCYLHVEEWKSLLFQFVKIIFTH